MYHPELSDTHVYKPSIRARLGTAAHSDLCATDSWRAEDQAYNPRRGSAVWSRRSTTYGLVTCCLSRASLSPEPCAMDSWSRGHARCQKRICRSEPTIYHTRESAVGDQPYMAATICRIRESAERDQPYMEADAEDPPFQRRISHIYTSPPPGSAGAAPDCWREPHLQENAPS